jgi:hypothetical protein
MEESMRTPFKGFGLATAIIALTSTFGCYIRPVDAPAMESFSSIQVLDQPDERTLMPLGHVTANKVVVHGDRWDEEALAALKEAAWTQFPDTTVLYQVHLFPGDEAMTFHASGIAARMR